MVINQQDVLPGYKTAKFSISNIQSIWHCIASVLYSFRNSAAQLSVIFFLIFLLSASWQEAASMVFLFSKIANFVLFARSDLRLGLIYLIFCLGEWLVIFLLFRLFKAAFWAFSIYKKNRKISIGNFHLGRVRSICHKSHSFTGPSMSLRCL